MQRRGFLRAVGAAVAWILFRPAAVAAEPTAPDRIESRLRTALRERHVLRFTYRGFPREVQPHALGRFRNGRSALLGWQCAGGSRSEPPPGWRTFLLAQIDDLQVLDATFGPRADYHPEKSGLTTVDEDVNGVRLPVGPAGAGV